MNKLKSIILELDSYYPDRVESWLKENNYHKHFMIYILTMQRKFKILNERLKGFENVKCITYDDIFSFNSDNTLDLNIYYDFINIYTNNHITARLFDRAKYIPEYGIGNQNAFFYYTQKAYNTLLFLKEKKIEFICFRNTPHLREEWLLTKAVEILNIQFYCLDDYVFPWLFTIRKGHSRNIELNFKNLNYISKPELKAHITNCVNTISKSYNVAMPSTERARLGRGLFKYYNPFQNVKYFLSRPHRFVMKTKLYFYYKKNAINIDLKKTKYIVFFLHYQPEKTTLPDGFEFVDQFYAIKILSMMLPKNIKLLVREHPSMFTDKSDPKYRTIHNYNLVKELANAEFVNMYTDPFELIDNSLALASIKSTATFEAYIRKKPVIIFGDNHLNLEGVHLFKTIDDLKSFVNEVIKEEIVIENVIDNLTNLCYGVSISGLDKKPDKVLDYSFTRDIRENASFKLLSELLKQYIKHV